MTSLFLLGLNRGLFDSFEQRAPRLFSAHRSVRILLTAVAAPNRKYPGLPYRLHGGIRGSGHPDGTSTRDPLLTKRTKVETLSSDDFDSNQIHTLPIVDRSLQLFNPHLPVEAGGNGVAHGTGHEVAQGQASGPMFLKTLAIDAALQWRFEPLAPHGLSAPQTVVVNF